MKYLFEDNIDKFPYRLLTKGFDDILFGACSNKNLVKLCREDFVKCTYVFVDVNADNPQTVSIYNKLVKESICRDKQYIIPIPSIEYYFVRAFIGYKGDEFGTALAFGNYRLYGSKNYENFIKDILQRYHDCYSSRVFEETACICDNSISGCEPLSLRLKQRKLELSLPLLLSRKYSSGAIMSVIDRQKYLYYKQAECFQTLGIIHKILELK